LLALAFAACAHRPPTLPEAPPTAAPAPTPTPTPAPTPAPEQPQQRGEIGLASFYGKRFQGRRTASGERYDMHALTCAHPTAPFGTSLRVTDLETGRSVVVRVNDRGPFEKGRVVDLSLAAARKLGMVERGLARVRIEPLEEQDPEAPPEPRTSASGPPPSG
jgi:rare lipoprotein A